jgi:hypothetical protein
LGGAATGGADADVVVVSSDVVDFSDVVDLSEALVDGLLV